MHKTAIIFPGQGAQYTNMGRDFFEQFASSKKIFELANQFSPINMNELIFEKNEKLNETRYTQVAMLAVELAIFEAAKEKGLKADVYAGLSLGEYAALAACGAVSAADALALVVKRGSLMQEAAPDIGTMAAVMGLENEQIEEICSQSAGLVEIANYNCPGQTVITGEKAAVLQAMEQLSAAGAKLCIELNVSGPFHSRMLSKAGEELRKVLDVVTFHEFAAPYVTNVTAAYVTDKNEVKDLLVQQISSSVRWQQSIETMIANGVDHFIEIGPKKTLTGFLKKINANVKRDNIETVNDLANLCINGDKREK